MNWDINVIAGLVAGIAAMIPGAIIYDPRVLGTAWMKEINHQPGKASPVAAVGKMFITSLINGLVASLIVYTIGAKSIGDAVEVGLLLAWFWVAADLMLVFFENRSWKWFQISTLSHVLTGAVIGLVLGLFL
jgi:hypothetical protein